MKEMKKLVQAGAVLLAAALIFSACPTSTVPETCNNGGGDGERIDMLANEWNMETALEVREEEGFERGVETVAVNALAEGLSLEQVHRITGLDMETITSLSQRAC